MHPIVDFHVHVFPEFLAPQALAELKSRGEFNSWFDGTLAGLRDTMQQSRVTLSVVQPVATKTTQVGPINRWYAKLNLEPDIRSFGSLHPDLTWEELQVEIEFLREQGIPGVKMHPEFQNFFPDEDRLAPIYRLLQEHGLILLLHAGVDLGFTTEVKSTPQRILQVLKGFPRLKVVAAHLGGYLMWDQVGKYLVGQAVYFDTGYCLHEPLTAPMVEMIEAHGARKVLFASDAPWGNQIQHVANLEKLPLSLQEIRDIAGKNAYNLLNLTSDPASNR